MSMIGNLIASAVGPSLRAQAGVGQGSAPTFSAALSDSVPQSSGTKLSGRDDGNKTLLTPAGARGLGDTGAVTSNVKSVSSLGGNSSLTPSV